MRSPRIVEIFGPTVQGEGSVAGRPTIFVRTAGCDSRCTWCDTMFAVDAQKYHQSWHFMEPQEIADRVSDLAKGVPFTVTLSGGNPAIQPMRETCIELQKRGHSIVMETQGTFIPDWLGHLDLVTLSPKPPSSGERPSRVVLADFVHKCRRAHVECVLKVVIADDADLDFFDGLRSQFGVDVPLYVQPCNPDPGDAQGDVLISKYEWLIGKVLERGWHDTTVLPQLHALVWGNERAR